MNNGHKDRFASMEGAVDSKAEVDVKEALLLKRESLIRELQQIDAAVALVQEEYSRKLEQLQAQKRPSEEALQHVEALLRLEGYSMVSRQNTANGSGATAATGTASALDAAFALLEGLHKPMHYKEIVRKLQEQDIYIPGKDPAATLLSKMNRDGRFKRTTSRGTYALSTWRVRAAKTKRTRARKAAKR